MIDIEEDLVDVFYNEDDFASVCTRVQDGLPGEPFPGILATLDQERFEGQVQAGTHQLQFPASVVVLQVGDTVLTQRRQADGELSPPRGWRVLRTPERVVDGRECTVWLTPQAVAP